MKEFIKAMDNLPWIVKVILCVPALDIIWAIYRIVKGVVKNNLILTIVGIVWIVPGVTFGWLIDIVSMIFMGKLILA